MNYVLIIQMMIASIKAVESMMPQDTKGNEKFDAAIAMTEGIVGSVQSILPALKVLATTVVTGLRVLGIFKK